MRSRFFTDTEGFDPAALPADRVCVCLRLSRRAYEQALGEAQKRRITTGEYMDQLILAQPVSACGKAARQTADSPSGRFPPAPPAH